MNNINILDAHTANLIAAGEVVDRPSSALKELIENSIDAGASVITVEVRGGGVGCLRVTDNGRGMSGEDLGKSLLRHATSKLKTAADLERIGTLGFRGEALAAISAVTNMKIFTKQPGEETGWLLEAQYGLKTKISEAGCAEGTTVIAERMFENLPARQRFLRRDQTEATSCRWVVERAAFAHPEVSFRLIIDKKERLFTAGDGDLPGVIRAVLGAESASNMIPLISRDNELLSISGYISLPDKGRASRSEQNFYINKRYIRSKTIMSAVETAYNKIAEIRGRFPICVLCLSVDTRAVDVNVHPQKLEVKFPDDRKIFEAVYYAVKHTLESHSANALRISPAIPPENIKQPSIPNSESAALKMQLPNLTDIPFEFGLPSDETKVSNSGGVFHDTKTDDDYIVSLPAGNVNSEFGIRVNNETDSKFTGFKEKSYSQSEYSPNPELNYKIAGEAFYSYIIVESGEKLLFFDKHALHERIIYEEYKKRALSGEAMGSQQLLVPLTLDMSERDARALDENKTGLERIGFGFDLLRGGTVVLREIPPELQLAAAADTVRDIAAKLSDEIYKLEDLIGVTADKTAACKAAMKAGVSDPPEHTAWLIERAMQGSEILFCPHGRPVYFEMSKKELSSRFGRK